MLAAIVASGFLAACVPARWPSGDPKSLAVLKGSSINCLLVEKPYWNASLIETGHGLGLKMLAVLDAASSKPPQGADGVVVEGSSSGATTDAGLPVVFLAPRAKVDPSNGIAGVSEGVWPGIRIDDEEISTPSSAPWIETNLGYLRYLRSQVKETIWLANRPPPGRVFPSRRYQQALADAALAGARWVIAPEKTMLDHAMEGDPAALKDWRNLIRLADFLKSLPDVSKLETYSHLGVSVSPETGALVSGGVLDMIGAQHIPFRVVNNGDGMQQFFNFADPALVKFPATSLGRVAMRPDDVDDLEPIYRRVEVMVGRTNYGLRVFNGAGLMSAPYALPDGNGVLVLLANYTDSAAEGITLHVLGQWKKATLYAPGQPNRSLVMYPVKTATAVEIDSLDVFGAVRVE